MSEIDQGGFVYPHIRYEYGNEVLENGITLRQHYAGLAMQGILSRRVSDGMSYSEVAERAFVVADAMIEAGKQ